MNKFLKDASINIKLGEKYSNPELKQLKELTYVLDAKDNKDVNGDTISNIESLYSFDQSK